MKLWIRSQDRENLIPVSDTIYIIDTEIVYKYIITLAEYKTKERALEVLDEIQKYMLLPNPDGSAYVYQMPEE